MYRREINRVQLLYPVSGVRRVLLIRFQVGLTILGKQTEVKLIFMSKNKKCILDIV